MLIPSFLKGFEQQALAIQQAQNQGKILIIVQLSGGNDGLNTVIPFRNDINYLYWAKVMKTISELINSGVQTRVYYVSHGSFDTHVNQLNQQERLLKQYAESMQVFMDDMKANERMQDVMVMTFSEFGRRVKQNASNGTDHGTTNNVFLMGGKLKTNKNLMQASDLQNLDEGDENIK
jgi:uncharacterized protein (DUF1501 family)